MSHADLIPAKNSGNTMICAMRMLVKYHFRIPIQSPMKPVTK